MDILNILPSGEKTYWKVTVFVRTLCRKIIGVRLKFITLSDWIWIFPVWFFCFSGFFDCASITFIILKKNKDKE